MNNIRHDDQGNVIDEVYQIPPHLISRDKMLLCNQFFNVYAKQPFGICIEDPYGLSPIQFDNYCKTSHQLVLNELSTFARYDAPITDDPLNNSEIRRKKKNRTNRTDWRNVVNLDNLYIEDTVNTIEKDEDSDEDFIIKNLVIPEKHDIIQRNDIINENLIDPENKRLALPDEDLVFGAGVLTRSLRRRYTEKAKRDLRQKKKTR